MALEVVIPYTPRSVQRTVHHNISSHRFSVIVAHRRAGKTVCVINQLVKSALLNKNENARYAYVAPFFSQAKDIAWTMLNHYTKNIPNTKRNVSELWVEFPNNARITLYGSDNPDRMRGIGLDGCVIDEVAQCKPELWGEVVRPALMDKKGFCVFIGTPKGIDKFYELYHEACKSPDWYAASFPVTETGVIPEDEIVLARKTMTENEFKRELMCVKPGSLVYTSSGQVPIEQVKVGDTVMSHAARFRTVRKTMNRDYDGELIKITTYGDAAPIVVTPNHPIRVLNKSTRMHSWVKAEDINMDHLLLRPRRRISGKRFIDESVAEILACYISDGSVSKTCLALALGEHEIFLQERIFHCAKNLGINVYLNNHAENHCVQMVLPNTQLADIAIQQCGGGAKNKKIPFDLFSGYEQLLFDRLMLGDGCYHTDDRGMEHGIFVTISESLAYDVQMLAGTLGYTAGISRKRGGNSTINGREIKGQDKFEIKVRMGKCKAECNAKSFVTRYDIGVKVKSIEKEAYQGKVYNLEVMDDHSYVLNGRTVHNCDFTASVDDLFIPISLIDEATERELRDDEWKFSPLVISVDVARFGDDSSIITVRQGLKIREIARFGDMDLMTLADHVAKYIQNFKPDAVFVDVVGLGAGLVDRLRSLGYDVIEVGGASSPSDKRYYNKRAECWGNMRDWLKHGSIPRDSGLRVDLASPKYTIKMEKILIESKDDMKKRGLKSPDAADSLAIGFSIAVAGMSQFYDRHDASTYEFSIRRSGDTVNPYTGY